MCLLRTPGPRPDPADEQAAFLGGFVAGEGCSTICRQPTAFADGSPRLRFVFLVQVADRDLSLLESLRDVLGCGAISRRPRRMPHHLDTAQLAVRSHRQHRAATIPFAERWLPPTAKREQFERWRGALDAYERAHPTRWGQGPASCTERGCDRPVRGRGLCRSHYFRETGW